MGGRASLPRWAQLSAGRRAAGGGPGAGCRPAGFLRGKSPAPRSLSGAGTELVSRLAAPRDQGQGGPRGQEGRGRAGGDLATWPGDRSPLDTVFTASAGTSRGSPLASTLHMIDSLSIQTEGPPAPPGPLLCPPSFSGMAGPARRNTGLDSAPPRPPRPRPTPTNTARPLRSPWGGEGSRGRWVTAEDSSEPAPFHPPPRGAWRPRPIHLAPMEALCWGLGSEGLTSAPPL